MEPTPAEIAAAVQVKAQLDGIVVSIELTLVSIVQGSALGVLIATSIAPVTTLDWQWFPYIAVALLHILIFWSRAVVHTLSFISWPLDFTHNFLYVGVTLVEAWMISQLGDPSRWFLLNAVYSAAGVVLYKADLDLVRRFSYDFRGEGARKLYDDILADQILNVRFFMPASFVFHLVCWWMIGRWPEVFLTDKWHVALGAYQVVVFGWYLWRGIPLIRRRQGRIFQRLVDQREGEHITVKKDESGMDIIG